jgi:hypothetical protein
MGNGCHQGQEIIQSGSPTHLEYAEQWLTIKQGQESGLEKYMSGFLNGSIAGMIHQPGTPDSYRVTPVIGDKNLPGHEVKITYNAYFHFPLDVFDGRPGK